MLIIWVTIIVVTAAAPGRSAEKLIVTNLSPGKNSSLICKTPVCVQEASTILRKIDPTVDPCGNFYKFACGRYLDETVIPINEFSVNPFFSIEHKIENQILISLSGEVRKDDLPIFESMKTCYQACMDIEKIAKNTEKEVKQVLRKLGGWPILHGSSWNGTNFDWQKFVIESGQMGYDTYFFIDANVVNVNGSNYIYIRHPVMGTTPKILYSTNKNIPIAQAYVKYLCKVAKILGVNLEKAQEDILKLIEFEQKLIKISEFASKMSPITVGELEKKYPNISWIKYLTRSIASNIHINKKKVALVLSPDFLEAFYALIAITPNRVLANYGMWRIIRQSIPYTHSRLEDATVEFRASLLGKQIRRPRRDICVNFIKQYFSTALGSLYVRLHFDEKVQDEVISLIDNIRASLHDIIEQANWMDNMTKIRALDKLDSMSQYVGYPDELMDDEKLNDYYENLEVHPESFFKFHVSLMKFAREEDLYIRMAGSESKWIVHAGAHTTNALYRRSENSIDIRAGILQNEFFNKDRPNYMNYGAIGWIVGHEMTHGFDNSGSQFDKNGLLADWWQPETKVKYREKVNCFIKQYCNYTVKEVDMAVNGQRTLAENIADNGGLKAAYYAYNKWAQKNDREPQLPELDYTPQQMFWISAATSRCDKVEKELLKSLVRDEEHGATEFRVIGSMSDSPEFSKDFQCPPQSPMNPDNKCALW